MMPDRDDDNVVRFPKISSVGNDEIKNVDSTKAAIDWGDKYYAGITDDGDFKIINMRLPGKVQLITRKGFIESLEHLRITIATED